MKRVSLCSGVGILLPFVLSSVALLSACSKEKNEQTQATAPATTASAPASNAAAPQSLQGNMPKSGKVVKAMHAGGYTYMEMESAGRVFWIAATMMNVNRNDQVAWADAALMKNFKSPSLRRTFDEILFVSNARVQ